MGKSIRKCLVLLACVVWGGAANATTILSPGAVINNTLGECCGAAGGAFHMIDQSGLSSGFVSGVTDLVTYLGTGPTHVANTFGTLWTSVGQSGVVDFDLGALHSVSDFVLWNDANQNGASGGIKNFRLFASTAADLSGSTLLGSFVGSLGPAFPGPPLPAELFSFAPTSGRYIRLEIIDQWGDPNVNIGEVAFGVGAAPAPEPGTLALIALGLVGLGSRRRKAA